jgi:hypothetical protein
MAIDRLRGTVLAWVARTSRAMTIGAKVKINGG